MKMQQRRKKHNESLVVYLAAMRKIGALGGLEEEAIIKYLSMILKLTKWCCMEQITCFNSGKN
jgi:hypothetical protein